MTKQLNELTVGMFNRIYDDAKAYEELHSGLINVLSQVGFSIAKQDGRWYAVRVDEERRGMHFSPEGGFRSFEDLLSAIVEDIQHD